MPKIHIPQIDLYGVIVKATEHWRYNRTANQVGATPYDEPTLRSLISALVDAVNETLQNAVLEMPAQGAEGLVHLSTWDPVHGWIPVCQADTVGATCLHCVNKTKV